MAHKVGSEARIVAANTESERLVYYLHGPVRELRLRRSTREAYRLVVVRELIKPEPAVLLLPKEPFAKLMANAAAVGTEVMLRAHGAVVLTGDRAGPATSSRLHESGLANRLSCRKLGDKPATKVTVRARQCRAVDRNRERTGHAGIGDRRRAADGDIE